jgi:hypothetical protein
MFFFNWSSFHYSVMVTFHPCNYGPWVTVRDSYNVYLQTNIYGTYLELEIQRKHSTKKTGFFIIFSDSKKNQTFFSDFWDRCEVMSFRPGWSWLPLFHSISSFLGFITVFIISKSLCHIEEWYFPYISHMGTNFPEDMLFSTFLSFEGLCWIFKLQDVVVSSRS